MPIFTFSTRETKPEDTKLIKELKEHCERNSLNFSSVVVNQLKEHMKEIKRG